MHNDNTNPPTAPAAPNGADDLLNKAQAANLLGVSVRCLDGLMARRAVPYLKISSRICRFHKGDLIAHLRERFGVGISPKGGGR